MEKKDTPQSMRDFIEVLFATRLCGHTFFVRLTDDRSNIFKPLIWDTAHRGYYGVGHFLGKAWEIGKNIG